MEAVSAEKTIQIFRKHDRDNTGYVSVETLKLVMTVLGCRMNSQEISTLARSVGVSDDGKVKYDSFLGFVFAEQRHTRIEQFRELGKMSPIRDMPAGIIVEFLTDVEGNWEYFLQFIDMSKILEWTGEEAGAWGPGTLTICEKGILVFGGDAPDKGTGDIRFVKTLLSLKERYPDQIFLIIGNRDINKLRFYAELAEGEDGGNVNAYWNSSSKPYHAYLTEHDLTPGTISTLKWMLDDNMGCKNTTFKCRKRELALLHGKASDNDVLNSFRSSVDPKSEDPWMLNYLQVAELAVVIGDALFVHAGINERNMGWTPKQDHVANSVKEWVASLKAFKDSEIEDFIRRPEWRVNGWLEQGVNRQSCARTRGAGTLLDYGVPGGFGNRTVCYGNPFDNGNAQELHSNVEMFLHRSGIRRVFTGHQPHGQSPSIVRHSKTGLLHLACDTSYSDCGALKLFNPANNRGQVVNVVRLEDQRVLVEGIRADGCNHQTILHCDQSKDEMPHALVGRQLTDKSWVKAVQAQDGLVSVALGQGHQITNRLMHPQEVCLALMGAHADPRFQPDLPNLKSSNFLCRVSSIDTNPEVDIQCPSAQPILEIRKASSIVVNDQFCSETFYQAETFLFAMNGVIWGARDRKDRLSHDDLQRGIVATVNKILAKGKRVMFITNNSMFSRMAYVEKLLDFGIHLCANTETEKKKAERMIITSSYTCALFLKLAEIKRPFLICHGTGLVDELKNLGIVDYVATVNEHGEPLKQYMEPLNADNILAIVESNADIDAIIIGWDLCFNLMKIAIAATYLRQSEDFEGMRPIKLVKCSSDTRGIIDDEITSSPRIKRESGSGSRTGSKEIPQAQPPMVEKRLSRVKPNFKVRTAGNGTMCRTICESVGRGQEAINVGKPSEMLIELLRRPEGLNGYGLDLSRAVMIGDSLETDIEFANSSGMKSLLVLSGVSTLDELRTAPPHRTPTWVLDHLAIISNM